MNSENKNQSFHLTVNRCICGWFAVGEYKFCGRCGMDLAQLTSMCEMVKREMEALSAEVEAMDWPEVIRG